MTPSIMEIQQAAVAQLALLIEEFGEHYATKTSLADGSALDSIERDWEKLCEETGQVYREMVGKLVDSTDERLLHRKRGH
jgi:hypothetical protein